MVKKDDLKMENRKIKLENARVKYSSVIDLKNAEGQIQWSRYNAMLVVNTIFLGFIGSSYNKDFYLPDFLYFVLELLPVLGLILCLCWYKMTERGFIWTQFWMKEANKIEKEVIRGNVNPVLEGEELRDIIGSGITKKASFTVIGIFAFIYLLISLGNLGF
jgi:hypothetical protein